MTELIEVTGIVIASGPVGEYDKRVVLLTTQLGKISAFARGARKPGNQLMASSNTFAFGTFFIFPGKNSYTIEKAIIKNYFRELANDITSAYYGYYFLEMADYYARENTDETDMVKLLYYSLKALGDERIDNRLVRAVFELKCLVLNGEYPNFFECTNCGNKDNLAGFSIMMNGVVCRECANQKGVIPIGSSAVYTLQFIVSTQIKNLYSFTLTDNVLEEVMKVMKLCCEAYIDKKMKSLDILDSII